MVIGKAQNVSNTKIDYLKEELNTCIEVNGLNADVTIKLSEELDKLIVQEQIRRMRK